MKALLCSLLAYGLFVVIGCSSGSSQVVVIHLGVSPTLSNLSSAEFANTYEASSPRLYSCSDSPAETGDQKSCQATLLTEELTVIGLEDVEIDELSAGLYYFQVGFSPKDADCSKNNLVASGTFDVDAQGHGEVSLTIRDAGPSCSS